MSRITSIIRRAATLTALGALAAGGLLSSPAHAAAYNGEFYGEHVGAKGHTLPQRGNIHLAVNRARTRIMVRTYLSRCGEASSAVLKVKKGGKFSFDRTFKNGYRFVVSGRLSGHKVSGKVRARNGGKCDTGARRFTARERRG